MRTFCFSIGLLLLAMGANVTYAQNTVDLVPIINKYHSEYELDSLQSVYLRNVPCNTVSDTIYVIEMYSLWDEDEVYSMYWSQRFLYSSISGHEKDTAYIERDEEYDVDVYRWERGEVVEWYDTNLFIESMISQVERWDKQTMLDSQESRYGGEEFFTIIRIIFDRGKVYTESFELKDYGDPDGNGGLAPNIKRLKNSPSHIKTFRQHHTNKS